MDVFMDTLKEYTMTNTATKIKPNLDVSQPPMFNVVYLNDNQTTVDFVIDSLIKYFNYTETTAEQVTIDIHERGSAIVAVLPYEIAEQKGVEVTVYARSNGYPLQIKLEPDVS